jgi:hypothetical protein
LRFGRLTVPPFSIPDHITLSGEACWYPGAYTEQGHGTFGFLPPADDAFYLIAMVYEHWRLTRSITFFGSRVRTGWGEQPLREVCAKAFNSVAADVETGLVRCEPAEGRTRVDWGFCDTIRKSGFCLMPSLLRWAAARDLAELFQAADDSPRVSTFRDQMARISKSIPAIFGQNLTRSGELSEVRLLSATELGRKDDVWASAFAIWLGVLPPAIELPVARHLQSLYRAGGTVVQGQVRHLPPEGAYGGYWEQAGCERDRYQNGGYWATPSGWYIAALRKVSRPDADQFLAEYVTHLRRFETEGAPWEWVYPPTKLEVNPRYGSSVGCVCIALEHADEPIGAWRLTAPLDYQVIQRSSATEGTLTIAAELDPDVIGTVSVEAKLSGGDILNGWQRLGTVKSGERSFRFELTAPAGGWYQLNLRLSRNQTVIAATRVEHVGVGEIFVVAGQSNSANHGAEIQRTLTGLVSSFSGHTWVPANDPQPGASGEGGSFMPPFGDAMTRRFRVPIGIVAAGVGATSVREWLPAGTSFSNPPTLTNRVRLSASGRWASDGELFDGLVERLRKLGPHGFRALLWHQGESDANQRDPARTLSGNDYHRFMELLIRETRRAVGWEFPWFVAQATYHSADDPGSPEIRGAQAALWQPGLALAGPDSDKLGSDWRDSGGKGVHFTGAGLRAHAALWVDQVAPWLDAQLAK